MIPLDQDHIGPLEPMRVAIDLQWMVPGHAGGLENVAQAFLDELLTLDRWNHYTAILPACRRYDFDLRGHRNVRIASRDSLVAYWRGTTRAPGPRRVDAEIGYSLSGYVHPDLHHLRHVVLIADIQHEFFPQFFKPEDLAERRRRFQDAIERADYVCAISDFTRRTLIDRLAAPPEKVVTLTLAAARPFSPERARDDERRLEAFALRGVDYLLFPAHTWWHKNHQGALAALRILRDRHGLRPLLICTGAAREAQPEIEEQVRRHDLQGQVRFTGYRVPEDLAALYRNARALVFPSLFEGFGMPVLEAMASGCPVACSDAGSLPEVAGQAALLVDPRDHEGLAEAIRRILCEDGLAAALRAHGLAQAARFSWRRHTLDLLALLRRVHAGLRTA